jgi:predicted RND superfamily exporter protein
MNWFEKFLYNISEFQTERPLSTLLIIFAITLIFVGGLSSVKTVASLEKMMPDSTEEVKYFNLLRDEFSGKDSLAITIQIDSDSIVEGHVDISDYDVIKYVESLQEEINKNNKITSTYSLADYIKFFNYRMTGNMSFPDEQTYNMIINSIKFKDAFDMFVNYGKTTTMIVATTDVGTIDEQMSSLADNLKLQVDNFGHPEGIDVSVTGSPILQQTLGVMINKDKVVTFSLAAIFIFIALLYTFRRFVSAFSPLLIVVISAIWLYGTMGYFNIPISTLAGGVASMVMGIGIAYSIHILNRYKAERREGKLIREAVDLAVVKTGVAVIATSATTLVAFFAFVFGQMPEMGRFGMLMVIGIFYTMVLSIYGLPALLVIEEKMRLNKKRKEVKF